ncbi:MAG: hypothetical protein R3F37_10995 [Candidatus Competibacteraceae bacterium]
MKNLGHFQSFVKLIVEIRILTMQIEKGFSLTAQRTGACRVSSLIPIYREDCKAELLLALTSHGG